ncbi:MAG TPA: TIGR00730 family Rossman fold protein [Actinomycetota bacterium]|nr:TIGR00730 family Rossman fold protein [Actinomycetota bacterium]
MNPPKSSYSTGDPYVDERLRDMVSDLSPYDAQMVFEMMTSALALAKDPISRLDRKIANTALKEMRYAFHVFAPYRNVRKVTIFGSSRTAKGRPEYALARDFSRTIADRDWMVVTGAGPGIMEAGHEGAGSARSFGVNILLPFEATANPYIAGDPKLVNFKYFFTRKLMFIKESDAFVLLPGGFGTLDEAFELLTLIQTGKSDLHPIVMLDVPDGTYWKSFDRYLREELLAHGYISESDLELFTYTDDLNQAVEEIERFYRVYHSQRYVNNRLIFRLNSMPPEEELAVLSKEFDDVLEGPIEPAGPSAGEIRDNDFVDLPRIALNFDRIHAGRLRMLVDRLNDTAPN